MTNYTSRYDFFAIHFPANILAVFLNVLTAIRIYFTRVYEYIYIFLWTLIYFNFYFRDSLITFHLALENIFKGITVLRLFYLLPPVGGAALDIFTTSLLKFSHPILPLLNHFYIIQGWSLNKLSRPIPLYTTVSTRAFTPSGPRCGAQGYKRWCPCPPNYSPFGVIREIKASDVMLGHSHYQFHIFHWLNTINSWILIISPGRKHKLNHNNRPSLSLSRYFLKLPLHLQFYYRFHWGCIHNAFGVCIQAVGRILSTEWSNKTEWRER